MLLKQVTLDGRGLKTVKGTAQVVPTKALAEALASEWRDQGETATNTGASFAEQVRDYPELLTSQRFWGYALSSAFA